MLNFNFNQFFYLRINIIFNIKYLLISLIFVIKNFIDYYKMIILYYKKDLFHINIYQF